MPRITFVTPQGARRHIDAASGISLMMAAVTNGIDGIDAECGGSMACATCHVYIEANASHLPPASADESEILDTLSGERRPGSRLSCQVALDEKLDGLVVSVPAMQG